MSTLGLRHLVWRRRDVTSAAAGSRRREDGGAERRRVAECAAEVAAEADAPGRTEAELAAGVVRLRRVDGLRERLERQGVGRVAADRPVLLPATGMPTETDDGDDDEGEDEEDGEDETSQNDQAACVCQ